VENKAKNQILLLAYLAIAVGYGFLVYAKHKEMQGGK